MKKKGSNLETEVMSSVSSVVSFIKTHVSNRVSEANNKNMLNIEKGELVKLNNLIGVFIDEAFVKSSSEITNTLKSKK